MENIGTLLDTLVRLASLGASGVCIFAIFWIGWLLMRLPAGQDPERHKSLRYYMGTCIVIALISGGTGVANAMFNAQKVESLEREKNTIATNLDVANQEISSFGTQRAKMDGILNIVEKIIKQKEIEAAKTTKQTLNSQVQLLQQSIKQLQQP